MATASYVSEEMKALDAEAKAVGIVMMNEVGVDPGIDHMSAMRVIDDIRDKGGDLKAFETFTGVNFLSKPMAKSVKPFESSLNNGKTPY
jgi:saccharopine dehydrogenase (NAD+, L-glutamate forming)